MFGLSKNEKTTRLLEAVRYGKVKDAEKALKKGADGNYHDSYYNHPLVSAMCYRSQELSVQMMDVLLKNGSDVKYRFPGNKTLLHIGLRTSNDVRPGIQRLMDAGVNPDTRDLSGHTALDEAIGYGNWDNVRFLIEKMSPKASLANGDNVPTLRAALQKNAPQDVLISLIPHARAIQTRYACEELTALHDAVQRQNAPLVELLLKSDGVDVNVTNKDGLTPLHLAVSQVRPDMTDLLLAAGVALDVPDGKSCTPLYYAAANGSIRMVKSLLNAMKAAEQEPVLDGIVSIAAENGHARVLELIIAAGGDVNERDGQGRTPLMKAALANADEVLKLLLQAGAKPDLADNYGMQAYDHAVSGDCGRAKSVLARHRKDAVTEAGPARANPDDRYRLLSSHSIEAQEGAGLSMIFNFWTRQVMIRDNERAVPVVVQNFSDIERQEAIVEAYKKLKDMGGDAPAPGTLAAKPAAALKMKPAGG